VSEGATVRSVHSATLIAIQQGPTPTNPCRKGFNYKCQGSSQNAPPLPEEAQRDGWWVVDHERVKVRESEAARQVTKCNSTLHQL
jgi:hypothetical protein